nr:vegetative cell wall protein gp1-like [Vicugna pacos]
MYKRWAGSERSKPLGISTLQSLVNLVHILPRMSQQKQKQCCPPPAVLPPAPAVLPPTPADQAALPASTQVQGALCPQVPAEVPTPSAVPEVQAEVSPGPVTRGQAPGGSQRVEPAPLSMQPWAPLTTGFCVRPHSGERQHPDGSFLDRSLLFISSCNFHLRQGSHSKLPNYLC